MKQFNTHIYKTDGNKRESKSWRRWNTINQDI